MADTLNYNMQAPYFGAFSANHVDLLAPYWPAITEMVPQGKIDAAAYNCSGSVHFPGHIAPFGQVNHGDMKQHTDATFAAMHFVNHWKHTRDVTFFKETSWPFLKLVAVRSRAYTHSVNSIAMCWDTRCVLTDSDSECLCDNQLQNWWVCWLKRSTTVGNGSTVIYNDTPDCTREVSKKSRLFAPMYYAFAVNR